VNPMSIANEPPSAVAGGLEGVEAGVAGSREAAHQQLAALTRDLARISALLEVCIGNNTMLMEALHRSLTMNNRRFSEVTKVQHLQAQQLEKLCAAVEGLQAKLAKPENLEHQPDAVSQGRD
jgi:hypothetical protein